MKNCNTGALITVHDRKNEFSLRKSLNMMIWIAEFTVNSQYAGLWNQNILDSEYRWEERLRYPHKVNKISGLPEMSISEYRCATGPRTYIKNSSFWYQFTLHATQACFTYRW